MASAVQDKFEFDPFSAEVVANPDFYYRLLRDNYPGYYSEKYDTFFFSRFDDVWDALRIGDNALLATETNLPTAEYLRTHHNDGAPPFASTNPMAPGPSLPSPFYEEMRQAHIGPLRPKGVAQLKDFIRDLARRQLDEMLPRGQFNFSTDYAAIVPARVICHLFGLPLSVADTVMGNVNAIGRFKPGKEGVDFSAFFSELQEYIIPAIQTRREAGADGGNGLIDGLINYRQEPDR
ncbi:MAG: cytochrome P450, partial [Bacteroidales bacterium]|nr:cytochrome P450 [Bacteroidales bacterium]